VWSGCEGRGARFEVRGSWFEVQGKSADLSGQGGGAVALDHGAQNLLEEGAGAFQWNRVGSDGTEDATDCALDGELIGERTDADSGRTESFVLTPLTRQQAFVGVAERRACDSEGAAGEVIGFEEGAESGFHSIGLGG